MKLANLKRSDIIALLSQLAGICGSAGAIVIQTIVTFEVAAHPHVEPVIPEWAVMFSAGVGAAGFFLNQLIRIFSTPAGAPATAIVAGAKVVAPDTTVVHQDTPSVATNVVEANPLPGGTP